MGVIRISDLPMIRSRDAISGEGRSQEWLMGVRKGFCTRILTIRGRGVWLDPRERITSVSGYISVE